MLTSSLEPFDDRRLIAVMPNKEEAIQFARDHWIHTAKRSIQQRGRFLVALSGGGTPNAIYSLLEKEKELDWDKVFIFWSDERGVPPNHPDSNYHMAMESGLKNLPIPENQIFRMRAESNQEKHAKEYEEIIRKTLDKHLFDLVMLGLGEDGHTASLFPGAKMLDAKNLVASEFISEEKGWRMSFTFSCINQSRLSAIYGIGKSKSEIVKKVLDAAIISPFPASRIGTTAAPALWILDKDAASCL